MNLFLPKYILCATRFYASASQSESSQSEAQQQVGVSSGVGVGAISGSRNTETVNVSSDDPAIIEAGLGTVQSVADEAINDVTAVVLNAQNNSATEVETIADTYAQQSELQSEQTAAAVEEAQTIAGYAQSPFAGQAVSGEVADSSGGIPTSYILIALAAIGLIFTLSRKT